MADLNAHWFSLIRCGTLIEVNTQIGNYQYQGQPNKTYSLVTTSLEATEIRNIKEQTTPNKCPFTL